MVKNLYRFIARIERVVYYCDSSILLCLHGSPRDPARGHPSLSQACVTHWPICMCNMYCASPRIFKDARATENYDVLKCLWVASGFPIRIGTDAPRRVKAATREGHPAPWLAGDINNTWVRMQHLVGRGNVWTLRNLGVGDIIREAIRTVITKLRGRCQSTFAAVISCWDHSLQPFLCLRVSALISSIIASGPFATWSSLWCCVASLQFVLQIRM